MFKRIALAAPATITGRLAEQAAAEWQRKLAMLERFDNSEHVVLATAYAYGDNLPLGGIPNLGWAD